MLLDEICDHLLPLAANHRVADVRIGLGYTGVQLDNGRCGLAFTFRQEARGGCCAFREAGTLAGKLASEVAWCATSPDVITAAVGLATLNALTDPPLGAGVDALEGVGRGGRRRDRHGGALHAPGRAVAEASPGAAHL